MGVQLNIKDTETVRLARKLADQTGQSITAAIRTALERELDERENAKAAKIRKTLAMVSGLRSHWKPEFDGIELSTHHGELLYDESGLPK